MSYLPLSPAGRRYGRYPDNPFHPARQLLALRAGPSIILPASAMQLCAYKGPTRDQGQEGSCCGQAGASKVDLDYRQFTDWQDRSIADDKFMASASFVYKCDLIAGGVLGNDVGSSLHQTAITISQKGAATNTVEPYKDNDYSKPPTAAQYENGLLYRMMPYHFLPDLHSMKSCLAPSAAGPGHSFIFGISVYDSFENEWKEPGFMPIPDLKSESYMGGHAQHVLSYDDTIKFPDGSMGGLLVQNSWGDKDVWAQGIDAPGHTDGGCYWMPYAFITGSDPSQGSFAGDSWINHTGLPWTPTTN
jgi:C1A family cysteine protease